MAWVYVVRNPEGRFYIGMTTDLEQRLIDHNTGVSKWTKYGGPWKLVWSREWKIHAPDGAAELFGLKPNTLSWRMKALKIRRPSGQNKVVTT